MTRKKRFWVIVAFVCAACIVLAGVGAAGLYFYIQYRNAQWLATAESAFEEGKWAEAKDYFALYLVQKRDDEQALTKYAEASLNILQHRRGALSQAATAYRQLLEYHPDSQATIDKLFELYEKTGSWLQMEYYANDMLRNRPDDESLLFHRAYALDNLGRRDEAIDAYRALVDKGNARAEVYGSLARLLRERGYEQQASDVLDQAVEARPEDAALRVERARYYGLAHNVTMQEAELAEAARLAPDDPDVLALEAQRAIAKKEWEPAIEFCTKGREKSPERIDLWLMNAHALTRKGEPKQAAALLGELDPMTLVDNPDVLVTLSDLQISIADFQEADKTLRLYEEAYPERTAMIDYLVARKALAQGDAESAATKLASVAERLPGFAPAQYFLAQAYRDSGKEELAKSTIEAYLKKRPDDARARAMLAAGSGSTASVEELESAAARILARDKEEEAPTEPQVYVSTAAALFDATMREGDPMLRLDVVKELLERAIEEDRQTPSAYQAYADVLAAVDDLPGANAVVQRALDAGISEHLLAPTQAGLAIAAGDTERAWQLCETDTGRPEASVEDFLNWSSLFAARNLATQAERVLALGIARAEQKQLSSAERTPESLAAQLRIERVILKARMGEAAEALKQLQELEHAGFGDAVAAGDVRSRLNSAKLVVAEQLLNDGEEQQAPALALLEEVRKEEPQNSVLQALDAQLLLRKEPPELDKAEALFRQASEADPSNAGAWMGLGQVANARGDTAKAAEYVERAAGLAPNSASIQLQLAQLHVRLGRYLTAEKALQNVLSRLREDAHADRALTLELLANCLIAGKRLLDAEQTIGRIESTAGQLPGWAERIAALRSSLLVAKGSTDPDAANEAQAALRRQYEADPDNSSLMLNLVAALQQAKLNDEAEQVVKDYAQRHEADVDAWLALARFYLGAKASSTDTLASASEALTRALVVDPNNLGALRDMIEVQVRRGHFAEALAVCDRYLERAPNDPAVLHRKGSLLARTAAGQRVELLAALDLVDKALAIEERPEFLGTKGMILLALKDYDGALKSLQPLARGHEETSAELDAALAEAYLGVGQSDMAREYLTSAQRKFEQGQPIDKRILERLSGTLDKGGSDAR